LFKALKPVAELYAKASGHRSMGLKWDDLLMEEREDVQKVSIPIGKSLDTALRSTADKMRI
jgi:ubiquinol-cytochrome c reductase subunit 7